MYCYGDQMKVDEMGGECGMHGKEEKYVQVFRGKILRK